MRIAYLAVELPLSVSCGPVCPAPSSTTTNNLPPDRQPGLDFLKICSKTPLPCVPVSASPAETHSEKRVLRRARGVGGRIRRGFRTGRRPAVTARLPRPRRSRCRAGGMQGRQGVGPYHPAERVSQSGRVVRLVICAIVTRVWVERHWLVWMTARIVLTIAAVVTGSMISLVASPRAQLSLPAMARPVISQAASVAGWPVRP